MKHKPIMLMIAVMTAFLTIALYPASTPQPAQAKNTTPSHYIISMANVAMKAPPQAVHAPNRVHCMLCEYILLMYGCQYWRVWMYDHYGLWIPC